MTDSKGSVVVGDQGAANGQAEGVVVPDRGGHGEDPLGHAGAHAGDGASAVGFEVELAFEGVVDRLDDLAQRLEELFPGAGLLAFTGGAQQLDAGGGGVCSNAAP